MKKEIYILVGISASGKSTYAKDLIEYEAQVTIVHNADTIRGRLYGSPSIQGNGKEVFGVLFDEYTQALKDDTTLIIIDNTSLTCDLRKRYIQLAQTICPMFQHKFEINLVFFKPNLERSLKWDAGRDRHVPEKVIKRQVWTYEGPNEFEREHCVIYERE